MALTTVELSVFSNNIQIAEESIRQLSNKDFMEIKSYSKPPLAILAIFEVIGILLEPSKSEWNWNDDKQLLAAGAQVFIDRLSNVDKDNITTNHIHRINRILDRDDCQPRMLEMHSKACSLLGTWLRAVAAYAAQKQAV